MKELIKNFWYNFIALLFIFTLIIVVGFLLFVTVVAVNACAEVNSLLIFAVPLILIIGIAIVLAVAESFINWWFSR